MRNRGIIYRNTGERGRGVMRGYHNSPSALRLNEGASKYDVKTARGKVKPLPSGAFKSNYAIGFEVEKQRFHNSNMVQEYPLFKGFESDSSCGVEAVTNILPLLPNGVWRNKIFDMMYNARVILDDETSPSNARCGGHITISVDADIITPSRLYEQLRGNAGLILSVFRRRLRNSYCCGNPRMILDNASGNRYQVALLKRHTNSIEFRLPSRIKSHKQMMRRYRLFYELVDFSVTRPHARFSAFLNKCKPILLEIYSNDIDRTNETLKLAKHFQRFIQTGVVHADISSFMR